MKKKNSLKYWAPIQTYIFLRRAMWRNSGAVRKGSWHTGNKGSDTRKPLPGSTRSAQKNRTATRKKARKSTGEGWFQIRLASRQKLLSVQPFPLPSSWPVSHPDSRTVPSLTQCNVPEHPRWRSITRRKLRNQTRHSCTCPKENELTIALKVVKWTGHLL